MINERKIGGRSADETPEAAKERCKERIVLQNGDVLKVGKTEIEVKLELPASCVECGTEIEDSRKKAAEFIGGTYLCEACRKKAAEKNRPAPIEPPPTLGIVPQKAAPVAVTPAQPAGKDPNDILNKILRQDPTIAENNPAAVIEQIFKEIFGAKAQEEFPTIGGYKITKILGKGGFGAVYLAEVEKTGKTVALKTMLQTKKPNERGQLMFKREIEVCKGLKHPHIIDIIEYGESSGIHYFALEFMNGGSVWDLMGEGRRKINYGEAVPIMLQSLEGLAHAHKQGIIHRDLKPPNLLISKQGSGAMTVKVSDLGLAKSFKKAGMTRQSITVTGSFCGSPPYMAPEHITNYRFVKPPTDVFEMAATFYHILTGRTVWNVKSMNDLLALLEEKIVPIRDMESSVPPKVAEVIDRALSRQEEKRYRDAGEFLQAMKRAV
jgi:serine/threonine protein kinase